MTKGKSGTGKQSGWSQSATFRAIGRAAITAFNAQRPSLPKCGAKTRQGDTCQNLGMKTNGRCRLHGGRVPKGDQWHRMTYPAGEQPKAELKFTKKARQQQRRAKARERRLEQMTPEERARHLAWKRTHQPGARSARSRNRAELKAAVEIAEVLSKTADGPRSTELIVLDTLLDEARRRAAALETARAISDREGIFG